MSLYDRLLPFTTRRVVTLLMVIFLILFLVVFPVATSRLDALSGKMGMIDTQFSYTPAQVFQMVSAYGPEGRLLYMLTTLSADLLFPLDYALLFVLLLIITYRQAFPRSRLVRRLVWVPFVAALFDLLENAGVVTLLATFPQQFTFVAQAASLFTTLKWIFFPISFLLVIAGFVGLVAVRLRR